MLLKRKLKCSFCGKSAAEVAKLVAGRRGYICDVCAAEAHRIMSEPDATEPRIAPPQSPSLGYDPYFEWSDDRVYCSELVWKVFERGAGIELGELQAIAAFDLSHPAVQEKVRERYGERVPLDEIVISPAAIFEAADLETVYDN